MTEATDTRNWAKEIADLYAEGASDAEAAVELKITIKAFYKQMADNKAFAQLIEYGRTLSQAWWERQARRNVGNKTFNTSLWTFYMKNKHGWADKVESTNSNENVNTDLDTLRQRLYTELAKFAKDNTPELTDARRVLTDLAKADNEEN